MSAHSAAESSTRCRLAEDTIPIWGGSASTLLRSHSRVPPKLASTFADANSFSRSRFCAVRDIAADGFQVRFRQNLANQLLVVAQDAKKQVFCVDVLLREQ